MPKVTEHESRQNYPEFSEWKLSASSRYLLGPFLNRPRNEAIMSILAPG